MAENIKLTSKQYEVLKTLSAGVMQDHRSANLGDLLKGYKSTMTAVEVKDLAQKQGNLIEVNPHGGWLRVSVEGFAAMRAWTDGIKKKNAEKVAPK